MTRDSRAARALTVAAAVGAATASGLWGLAAPAANAATGTAHNGQISFSQGSVWYSVNPDGTGQHVVAPTGGGFNPTDAVTSPVFSPDGKLAVFTRSATSDLWISNADGTGARLLDKATGPVVDNVGPADLFPQWVDDSKIVFARNNNGGYFQINADGTGLDTYQAPGGLQGNLVFGPNGLVAAVLGNEYTFNISIYDPGTKKVSVVKDADSISFSPDGTKIAYTVYGGGHGKEQIFLANIDGTGATQLTNVAGAAFQPVWSPDGTEIAFAEQTWNTAANTWGSNNLDVIPAAGGAAKPIVSNAPIAGGYLAWDNGPLYSGPAQTPSPFLPVITRPTIDRLGGTDRVDTAVQVSRYTTADRGTGIGNFPSGPSATAATAVLARDDQFADALSGNALAVAKGGPLLLTDPAKLSPEVAGELTRILPPGATIHLLGGEKALSPQVARDVEALGFVVDRIGGGDRYATSVLIAQKIGGTPGSVALATGNNYPDALTAGAGVNGNRMSGLGTGVVLLTDDGTLPKVAKDYLAGINPDVTKVYAVGGPGVAAAASGEPGWHGKVTELSGRDRYATAAAVAASAMFQQDVNGGSLVPGIATGDNWPDALSGGALTGRWSSPLLLSEGSTLPASELGFLKQHAPMTHVGPSGLMGALPVFGGPSAVPAGVIKQVGETLYGAGKYDVFDNRHLVTIVGPF